MGIADLRKLLQIHADFLWSWTNLFWKLYNWGHIAHRYRFIVLRAEPTDCCAKDSWPAKFLIGPSKVSLSATSYIKKNCWYLEPKLLEISHVVSYFYSSWTTARRYFFLIHLFSREVLIMKKLEIKKTKPTCITSVLKVEY